VRGFNSGIKLEGIQLLGILMENQQMEGISKYKSCLWGPFGYGVWVGKGNISNPKHVILKKQICLIKPNPQVANE